MIEELNKLHLRMYDLSVVKSIHNTDLLFNAILDKFIFHVPATYTTAEIITNLVNPMHHFLTLNDFTLSNVKIVHFYLLDEVISSNILNESENGFETCTSPHSYIIGIKHTNTMIVSIMHELCHIIDNEINRYNVILHHELFPYELRYFENKAFVLSKIAFGYYLLTKHVSKTTKKLMLSLLDGQIAIINENIDELCENYDTEEIPNTINPNSYALQVLMELMDKLTLAYTDLESLLG